MYVCMPVCGMVFLVYFYFFYLCLYLLPAFCILQLLQGTGLFDGQRAELCIWLRHLENAGDAPAEVATFFVSLLRQFIPNPYPAIDRLTQCLEEGGGGGSGGEGGYLSYVR